MAAALRAYPELKHDDNLRGVAVHDRQPQGDRRRPGRQTASRARRRGTRATSAGDDPRPTTNCGPRSNELPPGQRDAVLYRFVGDLVIRRRRRHARMLRRRGPSTASKKESPSSGRPRDESGKSTTPADCATAVHAAGRAGRRGVHHRRLAHRSAAAGRDSPRVSCASAFPTEDTDALLEDMATRLSPRVIEAPKRLDMVRRRARPVLRRPPPRVHDAARLVAEQRASASAFSRPSPPSRSARSASYKEMADRRQVAAGRSAPRAAHAARTRSRWSSPATACCAGRRSAAATAAASTSSVNSSRSKAYCSGDMSTYGCVRSAGWTTTRSCRRMRSWPCGRTRGGTRELLPPRDDDEKPDGVIRRRPEPEVWSALEYTAHVADVFDDLAGIVKRITTEDHPTLDHGLDPDQQAVDAKYNEQDREAVLARLQTSAENMANVIANVPNDAWYRTGTFSFGERDALDDGAQRCPRGLPPPTRHAEGPLPRHRPTRPPPRRRRLRRTVSDIAGLLLVFSLTVRTHAGLNAGEDFVY